jgi:hypothetical protein
VRSVVVNASGDVFVLYSGGSGAYGTNIIPTTVHDSTGGRYFKSMSFKPSEDEPSRFEGFSFEGEPLQGSWFVRLGGGPLKGPVSVGFKQEFEPETKLAFTYTSEPERIADEIPSYMPFMYLAIGTREKWLELRNDALAQDRDRAKDFAGEEIYLRKLIDVEETAGGRSFILPFESYCGLAHALENEGKNREAYMVYLKARTALSAARFDPGPWAKKQIDGGIARLGAQAPAR